MVCRMAMSSVPVVRAAAAVLLCSSLAGCGGGDSGTPGAPAPQVIAADGSSTVFPVTEAFAEEFQKATPGMRVTVGSSGTGGGFEKFCRGETDISDASRPISAIEVERCAKAGIEYIELPVAYDGLAVMVHPRNTWVDHLTVAELKKVWEPAAQGKVTRWSQIRAGWPDREIRLFGPGVDSGTFDYFTEVINGKTAASRGDYTSSEDDNVLVQGISGDENALGYFGFAYYEENRNKLKLVPIDDGKDDNGKGPILPSPETVSGGTYRPLSRPIFIYVKVASLQRPEVAKFVGFYLTNTATLVREVGYIPFTDAEYALVRQRFDSRRAGSMYHGAGLPATATLQERLKQ
jgi:phosphate transport system substrate-binding protein